MDGLGVFDIKGIKCDSCDWKDDTTIFEEYESWLNKPCPDCGANLLTKEDHELCKSLIKISEVLGLQRGDTSNFQSEKDSTTVTLEMNGTGKISGIKINPEK